MLASANCETMPLHDSGVWPSTLISKPFDGKFPMDAPDSSEWRISPSLSKSLVNTVQVSLELIPKSRSMLNQPRYKFVVPAVHRSSPLQPAPFVGVSIVACINPSIPRLPKTLQDPAIIFAKWAGRFLDWAADFLEDSPALPDLLSKSV